MFLSLDLLPLASYRLEVAKYCTKGGVLVFGFLGCV